MAWGTPLERLLERSDVRDDKSFNGSLCILWVGSKTHDGYGMFRNQGTKVMTHRFAYEYFVGPIGEGLQIDHLCRNRSCFNVRHLEPVTPRENTRRGGPTQRTHCPLGHPYAGKNLYVHPVTGNRQCKECRRTAGRKWWAANGMRVRHGKG